jgi:poly-gamma-glutamate capsule biosynthesis protein CapA/YwtB (metallophosphatase superfamily)
MIRFARIFLFLLTALSAQLTRAGEGQVKLIFAGDVVLDGKPGESIRRGEDPFAEFAELINRADIRLANLECVVATGGDPVDKNYNFRARPESLATLRKHFDVVTIANNHSGDFGRGAFEEMITLLPQYGIQFMGGGHNLTEAHQPAIVERNGLRIALLGYNEFMPRSFEADANAPGTAWSEDEQVAADIHRAREVYHADLVIPVMHWGWENETHSNLRQQQLAHLMISAGADLVLGTHPHVTQEVEYFQGKPIIYSIGNFMIDALDNDLQMKAWVVAFDLDRRGVVEWHTYVAQLNENGLPKPVLTVASPCGDSKLQKINLCYGGKTELPHTAQ